VFHNQSASYSIKLDAQINEAIESLPYNPFIGRKTDFGKTDKNIYPVYSRIGNKIQLITISEFIFSAHSDSKISIFIHS
jgi:hypothetical protein